MRGISKLAEDLLASQDGLCSLELFIYLSVIYLFICLLVRLLCAHKEIFYFYLLKWRLEEAIVKWLET
jgi:hypothetical protein